MREFKSVIVAEVGATKNKNPAGKQIVFTDKFVESLCRFDKIRCSFTHIYDDGIEKLVGKFTNFAFDGAAARADLTLMDNSVYADQAEAIIEFDTDLINCSIVVIADSVDDGDNCNYTHAAELLSIDLVCEGAATNSFFNSNQNNNNMGLLSLFGFGKKAESFATHTLMTEGGEEIVIEAMGEVIAVGDAVKIAGEPAADGEYTVVADGDKVNIKVEGGLIVELAEVETTVNANADVPASENPTEEYATKEDVAMLTKLVSKLTGKIDAFAAKTSAAPQSTDKPTQFAESPTKEQPRDASELAEIRRKYSKI